MDRVYLDYAATTPVDAQVIKYMLPYFDENYGNPSSIHYYGQIAESAISQARKKILKQFNASDAELIFTSGGSESDNLGLRGVQNDTEKSNKRKILISPVEHPAITNTCAGMDDGMQVEKLRVDKYGLINFDDLSRKIDINTCLVSIIWANNELGTINDIASIGKLCKDKGVLFHTDAVQAAAHLEIDWDLLGIGMLSFGAHKFYGPKGIGGLIKQKGLILKPLITGGGQENNWRAGTQNVPLIMGMAKAYELVHVKHKERDIHLIHLRNMIIETVLDSIPGSYLTGHPEKRLPNHSSFVFEGVKGQDLVIGLDMAGFAVSSGSACKVGNPTPSQTLLALGIPEKLALGALRVTVGKFTTEPEVRAFLETLQKIIAELRINK